MFLRLAQKHREFVKDLVMNLQALAIVLENRGYLASCYTCGNKMNSASFMVSLGDDHLIRFLVSDYGITWTEMRDDRELMKLEGAEAISQLQDLANLVKYQLEPTNANANLETFGGDHEVAAQRADHAVAGYARSRSAAEGRTGN